TQIDMLLNPKKKVYKWQPEDISSAITLRSISPKAYRYLREEKHFPLVVQFPMEPGILSDVMTLMKAKGETLDMKDKLTVVSFDETYLSRRICFDKKYEKMVGPYKCVQTVIVRVAIVSDMGPSNVGLWRDLGISMDKTYFEHPVTKQNIYIFADASHLLKLARNHFLDKGFVLPNGKYIERHLLVEGANKMNVKLAAHIFANSVAKSISYLGNKNKIHNHNWKEMVTLVKKKIGLSTLRTRAVQFPMEPGILSGVMTLMKAKGETLDMKDKLTVVSFDETYVSRRICFDKKYEQMVGLVASWKQPVYYSYDTPMTKQILTNIICNLYEIMYNVVAIVSDMGPSNVGLWRDLVEGANRMNVKLAAHIFSNSVAKSISYLGNKNKINNHNWKEASEVIQLFNDWFDLLNTQQKFDKNA
ncbi:Uncharacterized protein FWK35_00028172, partial [Aphis craccivora]